jgi:hypothetical protein
MRKKQPRDMAVSIKARLLNYAKRNSEAFDLVLVRFALERLKSIQWNAFLKKSGLSGEDMSLSELAGHLADFLMPPALAAGSGDAFDMLWKPAEGWIGRTREIASTP